MKCAIYARVSTADQNCEMQLRELREYLAKRGWESGGEYVDTGWSGKLASRPQLNALMADARKRKFDVVAVWKLDRWGRSVSHLIHSVQELGSLGIAWVAVTQGLDTSNSNPTGVLLLHILAAVAQFEREMIRERVTAGMAVAKRSGTRSGKRIGRPRAVVDKAKIQAWAASGWSVRDIAGRLGVGRSTVHRLLSQNPPPGPSSKPLERRAA